MSVHSRNGRANRTYLACDAESGCENTLEMTKANSLLSSRPTPAIRTGWTSVVEDDEPEADRHFCVDHAGEAA